MAWLIVGYMVLYIHRPFEIWPWLGALQMERVYAIVMLLAMLVNPRRPFRSDLPTVAMLGLAFAFVLSAFFSPWYGSGKPTVEMTEWGKILVVYFVVIAAIKNRVDARILLLGLGIAIAIYVGHTVLEYFNGRHSWRGSFARIRGINTTFAHAGSFSMLALIGLLIAPFIWRHYPQKWVRWGVLAYGATAIYGVLWLAGSRTGFVGLLFVAGALVAKSRYKMRIAVGTLCLAPIIWSSIPSAKQEWYQSTWSSEDESAESRTDSFYEGLALFRKYPLLGSGPGTWQQATGWDIESHNLYGQLVGEVGLMGTVAFCLHIFAAYYTAWQVRKLAELTPDDTFYLDAAVAFTWIITMLLFLGLAGGTLFRFTWVWIPAMLVTMKYCQEEEYTTFQAA